MGAQGSDLSLSDGDLTRRGFLWFGAAFASSLALFDIEEAIAQPRVQAARPRVISIANMNTGEQLNNVEYWARGRYQADALAALNHIMRDHRTGDTIAIEPSLFDLVLALQNRLGHRGPINLLSGYRSAQTNSIMHARDPGGVARNSYHIKGQAMDIRLSGVTARNIYLAALSNQEGGVGFYPHTDFVHLDVGPTRQWTTVPRRGRVSSRSRTRTTAQRTPPQPSKPQAGNTRTASTSQRPSSRPQTSSKPRTR